MQGNFHFLTHLLCLNLAAHYLVLKDPFFLTLALLSALLKCAAQRVLIYNNTFLSVCQHLFSIFFNFFQLFLNFSFATRLAGLLSLISSPQFGFLFVIKAGFPFLYIIKEKWPRLNAQNSRNHLLLFHLLNHKNVFFLAPVGGGLSIRKAHSWLKRFLLTTLLKLILTANSLKGSLLKTRFGFLF